MPVIDIWLKFESDQDRERFVGCQRTLPDGDFVEGVEGVRFRLESDSEDAGLVRAHQLRDGFCAEAGIDRDRVGLSLHP